MKQKKILSIVLTLCLLLTLAAPAAVAVEDDSIYTEDLLVDELDSSSVDVDLKQEDTSASDLAMELPEPDENVKVIIVMEAESVIEADADATLDSRTQAQAEALAADQADVVAQIEEEVLEGEALDVSYSYTWLLNGVSAVVPYSAVKEIEAVDGVKQVLLQPVYEICETSADPQTIFDGVMIGRESTWADGYTGKGIRIAIIDTGLDVDHQNFAPLTEDKLTATSATADTVAAVLPSLNANALSGGRLTIDQVYHNTKVAYGFNYCDNNINISHDYDLQGDHGTHVAGIAAANKIEGTDVVGVAPDAQLYIMKVFGEQGGAYTEDILAALEDALMLGADVVNMSLGASSGFTQNAEEIDAIYDRVAQTNTVLAVSAGNAYTAGLGNLWGTNANLTSNPDNAVVSSPAVYANVLSVASVENLKLRGLYIDADGYLIGYLAGGNGNHEALSTLTGAYKLVAVPGHGEEADYEGLDVTGKVALVQRGVTSFPEKCDAAAKAGAIACIVYNNITGTVSMDLTGSESTIPCVSITLAGGSYLLSALESDPELTLTFPEEEAFIPNEEAYRMSEFSSWGAAPDLSLEPDITAPGGNIFSTVNGGGYDVMSGTSMAAPNVAGISALVMQYARESFEAGSDYRTLVKDLLMSTSTPLTYDEGLYYSPRSQGSGLANAFNAVSTQTYLTVDGCDTPKGQLGDDPDKTGLYSFTFNMTNFGTEPSFYSLNTAAQTEGYTEAAGQYFMSSTPVALEAATSESSEAMSLRYDVDANETTDSHDAYLIYLAAAGKTDDDSWKQEAFRYDLDNTDTVTTDDVQAYLEALVGNDSPADLTEQVVELEAGATAAVSVTVALSEADKAYFDTYYPNGGYVEGFTFLTALNAGGVDLSLPYLGFYGDWTAAPVLDDSYYWDLLNAEDDQVVGNQTATVLFTNLQGGESEGLLGVNPYADAPVDMIHAAISPNGDGSYDYLDEMYISQLRNAASMTIRYTDMTTGEVYDEQVIRNVTKSSYNFNNSAIVPTVLSWLADGTIPDYNWTDSEGNALPNNSHVELSISVTGVGVDNAEGATETLTIPITVDVEAPELLGAKRITDEATGKTMLELSFRDNQYAAAVVLLNSNGTEIYAQEAVEDVQSDADGYRYYTFSYDITDLSGKLVAVLADYAANEAYYGLNVGGAGAAYGQLVGYQYNYYYETNGWVSFNKDVDENEVQISMDDSGIVAAEYVNGYVFAQDETGALYGCRYEELLDDNMAPNFVFITQLENVYQDLAYNYADGNLYGLFTYENQSWDGTVWPTTELHLINLEAYTNEYDEEIPAYTETWVANQGGLYGLTMAIDDEGIFYLMANELIETENPETWEITQEYSDAQLWTVTPELIDDGWYSYVDYSFEKKGDTGLGMDYLQSMTWDHNEECLYWARFYVEGWDIYDELIKVDPETGECTVVGDLSGETFALFAPLSAEAAAREEHSNLPDMDPDEVGRPILRDDVITMSMGSTRMLAYDLDPWYTNHKDMVWSSDNSDVVSVDGNGIITALAEGSATITVAARDDENLTDSCTVQVCALSLKFEGIISGQSAGVGSTSGVGTYEFAMEKGVASLNHLHGITAPDELNFGLSLATSAMGRGHIWACEYGNTGMIYEIDPETGVVVDALEPLDGDMLFGMSYSESQDTFSAIMNMYLYVDVPMKHSDKDEILDSYDEERNEYMWHKLDMLPYLIESNTGFVTGEDGNGASSEIVFCGITTVPGTDEMQVVSMDYMGNYGNGYAYYTADQTLVLLDNVGRLWYIDEICGMTGEEGWGSMEYFDETGESYISGSLNGVLSQEYVAEDGTVTYNVFVIRELQETPLTDMFRQGTMPRITYHFSDIEYAGTTDSWVDEYEEVHAGDPIFALSLYDYWNNGTSNELYLYIPGRETGEMDYETWQPIRTPDRLFDLGNTGSNNIIATIHTAEVTGGLDSESSEDGTESTVQQLAAGVYTAGR